MNNKFTVNDLNLYYGDFHALKNINLDIKEKEITAFIGPSGCGKSTFLKTLNRMNDLVESTKITGICLDGTDIYKNMDAIELRRRVGMVFQQPNPFPKSIYDNIAYGPRIFGIKKKSELDEIVERSLRQAAIWDEVKDRLHKSALGMSGGQQQRLCIARALAMQPEVLLMDEPTSALDPISTSKIEELTLELKKDYTIVIVTHNMQQAMRISDKTAFFLLGDLIEYSDTETLFSTPTKFLKQTKQLELTMTQMSQDCLKGLWFCKHAILDGNKTLVQDVSQMHEEVSEQGREAEQICMKILLLQHPVAKDLRRITVATNTIRDLTRIMDQEKEVSELICALNMEDLVVDDSIQQQFIIAKEMITLAIEGFIQKDEKAADQVIKMDDQADAQYEKAKEVYVDLLARKEHDTGTLVDVLLVGKYLERICDHCVNIGKWVLYQKSGIFEAIE